ncbi:glycoside hydrolase family 127 protein [Streptomyces sp. FIT100]|uniref:glycoside hydrolase family 127 protein n=1 Tax=Streptomyces sp. FIT100 TaxID=2837956 RepID=UPI0021C64591|nr:beta-L-arabinofuranosidase domain-containing protein [Streptomyces sp. FIT100]UUN30713.1 glycoside hydrolase family 127 protein [Streptomyces sp. FIT100]
MNGPIVPTPVARTAHRPVVFDRVELTGGLWQLWQKVTRENSLPLAFSWLEKAGNFDNLRQAAGERPGAGYRGPVAMDSDVAKVLETAAFELQHGPDDATAEFIDRATALLEAAQQDDGYLHSHSQVVKPGERWNQLVDSHEMYCAGHLFQAAVAARRSFGDERLLAVARRFADRLVADFLDREDPPLDGHPEVETALVELYRVTGEERYLALARKFVDERGRGLVGPHKWGARSRIDHLPVREAPTITGHAVRALYMEAGVVDLYLETGDESLLRASVTRWEDMVASRTALTGGLGSRQVAEVFGEAYELPPDLGYNETCAQAASIQWSWRLLLATGDARYADLIERTLYNGFASARSADGKRYYKGNPLQRRADHADHVGDPRYRDEWFYSACCPPAFTRIVAALEHYLATVAGDTLYVQQYAPTALTTRIGGGTAKLRIETGYPWDGTVTVTVDEAPGGEWGLAFRIPPWSTRALLEQGGSAREVTRDERGYVTVQREWRAGDTVSLHLDMMPRLTVPHPRIDALRGCAAIERGPLVYCFEQIDLAEGVDVDELALLPGSELRVTAEEEIPGIGRTVRIEADTVTVAGAHEAGLPYLTHPPASATTTGRTTATALPYFQWDNRGDGAMRVWMPLADN